MSGNNRVFIIVNAAEAIPAGHDAILQTLDAEIGGKYYPLSSFEKTVDAWQDIPVIFGPEHPDPEKLTADMAAELERVKGRLVGKIDAPVINRAGHPRLMSKMIFTDEARAEMDDLISKGALSLSTGFWGIGGKSYVDGIVPNHVLVFTEGYTKPKDPGSGILNAEPVGPDKNHNVIRDIIEKLKNFLAASSDEEPDPGNTPAEGQDPEGGDGENEGAETMGTEKTPEVNAEAVANAELKQRVAQLNAEIESRDALIKAFEKKEAEANAQKLKEQWEAVKNSIPAGMVHKPEDEAALKQEFETDPRAFAVRMAAIPRVNTAPEEGDEYTKETNASLALQRELKESVGRA